MRPHAARRCVPVLAVVAWASTLLLLWAADPTAAQVEGGPEGLVFGEDPRKPTEVTDELMCHSCHALVAEVHKKLHRKASESDVYDAVEGICSMDSFRTYKFIPPQMVKGCNAFKDEFGDNVEALILRGVKVGDSTRAIEDRVCQDACDGVTYQSMDEEREAREAEAAAGGDAESEEPPKTRHEKKKKAKAKKGKGKLDKAKVPKNKDKHKKKAKRGGKFKKNRKGSDDAEL